MLHVAFAQEDGFDLELAVELVEVSWRKSGPRMHMHIVGIYELAACNGVSLSPRRAL